MTNTNDSGPGSLRQAILDANAATGPQTITFDIPNTDPGFNAATGTWTIIPASALPQITNAVTIDGYSQPGSSVNTLAQGDNAVLKIVLDGVQRSGWPRRVRTRPRRPRPAARSRGS